MDQLDPELLALLRSSVELGSTIPTLSHGQPNKVLVIDESGVLVETEHSRATGKGPQLVHGWMLNAAWKELAAGRRLTNKHLLSSDGLGVKRSSAVCALLAQLPGVTVESSMPIVLTYTRD